MLQIRLVAFVVFATLPWIPRNCFAAQPGAAVEEHPKRQVLRDLVAAVEQLIHVVGQSHTSLLLETGLTPSVLASESRPEHLCILTVGATHSASIIHTLHSAHYGVFSI